MRKFFYGALAFIFVFLPIIVMGQGTITFSGVVTDEEGNPLYGANVYVVGTQAGGATDDEGFFSFELLVTEDFTLVVDFVGYKKHEQVFSPDDNLTNVAFQLEEDLFMGETIVVTGIATKRSKAVAEVAVSRVDATKLSEVQSYGDISQMVTGRVAGVNIQNPSGNVGSGMRFNIRSGGGLNGDEQPLLIIDGVRMDNSEIGMGYSGGQGISTLADVEPENIESIEFLKGPAASASYGTNGANGVVLITTKRGGQLVAGTGRKFRIDYKIVTGWHEQHTKYDEDMILSYEDVNANFKDGPIQSHSLSFSGGSNTTKYFASVNRHKEVGIMPNNTMDRTAFQGNMDLFPSEKVIVSISSGYTFNNNGMPGNDDNIAGFLGNTILLPVPYFFNGREAIRATENTFKMSRFIGSAKVFYTPLENLEVTASIGVDEGTRRQEFFRPQPYTYSWGFADGWKTIDNTKNTQFTYEFNTGYTYNPMPGLTVKSSIGTQLFDRKYRGTIVSKWGFNTDLISNIGAGSEYSDGEENYAHWRDAGIFTTHSASYRDQYYMTLMLRKDYASAIGREAPSIYYPGISMAVRMDKYDFFPKVFDMMKVRLAYGESGQLPNRTDPPRLLWGAQMSGYGAGAWINSIGNEEIKPERIKEFEIGFDMELFKYYSMEFTYYRTNAENSIINFWNAPSSGLNASAQPFNVGGIEGWGIESLIQARPIRMPEFELNLSMTNNYKKNKVTDLGGAPPIFDGMWGYNVIMEGYPKHAFFIEKVTGARFDPVTGAYTGPILAAGGAKVYCGQPVPDFTGSLSLNMVFFKDLRLDILAEWAQGHEVLNFTRRFSTWFGGIMGMGANVKRYRELEDMLGIAEWYDGITPLTVGSAEYRKRADEYAKLDPNYVGNYVEDGSYLKLREISLSYSLKEWIPEFYGNKVFYDCVLGISVRNLFTISGYEGPDPEINMGGARTLTRGFDFLTLQQPRTYTLWLRLSL